MYCVSWRCDNQGASGVIGPFADQHAASRWTAEEASRLEDISEEDKAEIRRWYNEQDDVLTIMGGNSRYEVVEMEPPQRHN